MPQELHTPGYDAESNGGQELIATISFDIGTVETMLTKARCAFGRCQCENLQTKTALQAKAKLSRLGYSTADGWPKVLSLRTLLVRSVQHLVKYTKMFVCMSSFRIRLMTSSLKSTNGVTALEPYIPFITDY